MGGFRTTAITAVGIAVIAVGCGGGDGSTSTSTPANGGAAVATKPEFIFSAETICVNERKGTRWRGSAYRKEHRSEGLPKSVLARDTKTAVLLETAEAEIVGIRQLPRPAGDEARIKAILNEMQAAVHEARQSRVSTSSEAIEYLSHANGDLRTYGLSDCVHQG
jgi:hypothetical protein